MLRSSLQVKQNLMTALAKIIDLMQLLDKLNVVPRSTMNTNGETEN